MGTGGYAYPLPQICIFFSLNILQMSFFLKFLFCAYPPQIILSRTRFLNSTPRLISFISFHLIRSTSFFLFHNSPKRVHLLSSSSASPILSANHPCIAIKGAYLLCQAVEIVEDGVIGIGRHAVHLAYRFRLPRGKDEQSTVGTCLEAL